VEQYFFGSTSKYFGGLRTPTFYNANLTINRKFQIVERLQKDFLAEATNLFNQTQFYANAVSGSVSAVLAPNAATNTKVGQNSNVNHGSLGLSLYETRQITLSLRLRL